VVHLKEKVKKLVNDFEQTIKRSLVNEVAPGKEVRECGIPSLRELRKLTERRLLSSFFPYETYEEDCGLYFNKDTVGFMLLAHPSSGLGLTELKILNGLFAQMHKAEACIQVSLISDTNIERSLDYWAQSKGNATNESNRDIFKLLTQNRVNYLRGGKWKSLFSDQPFLVRNMHLVISYTVPSQGLGYDEVEDLKRMKSSFLGTLRSAKIHAENLMPDIFINIMNGILNPKSEMQPKLDYDSFNLISKQISDEDTVAVFDSGISSIIHQDQADSVIPYHVRHFPQRWAGYQNGELIGSFYNNILRIACPFVVTLTVNIPDQLSAKGMVKRKFTRATQMADSPISKYATQWKDRKQDWEYTAEKVDNGEKLLQSFYQIILLAPEGREQECQQSLLSLYESLGWVLARSRYIPMHAFLGAMPMGLCTEGHKAMKIFGHYSSRLSWNCTNTAPWIADWKGTQTPMMLFTGRRGQIVYFNPFDNNKGNFNLSCCATAGSGKSFFTQECIFSALGSGGRAFIIDSGHSYKNLCELLQGTYIDFGEGRPNLNPFSKIFNKEKLRKVMELAKGNASYSLRDYINDFMPMLKDLLGQMASPLNPLEEKSNSLLEKALTAAIAEYGEETTVTRVAEKCLEQKDEQGVILEIAKDLALMLHPYTKDGMFARYFEGQNNIDLENSFVVLELDALNSKGPLQSVVLLILMIQINQVMYLSGNKKQIKQVIIDEAWRLLGAGRAGSFIEEGYRVARKHGGSYMTITQKISDYYKSETARAAFMNSDFVIYLRQKPEELSNAETMGYIDNSDGKVDVLRSLETIQGKYSELAISSPDGLGVVRFCVDQVTEKIYSTKAEEVDFIREAQKKGVHLFAAIDELIKDGGTR
jgi:conjugal transfer ATP-binding protein TraC